MKRLSESSLADQIFHQDSAHALGARIHALYPDFPTQAFTQEAVREFPKLKLKERIHYLAESLYEKLPSDYLSTLKILLASLPPKLDEHASDNDFGNFINTVYSHYVALYGCQLDYLDHSLSALREITQRFSAEFAVRYFLNAFPEQTLRFLYECSRSDNYHVRRLASEGTRPKLPWAIGISLAPQQALPILHQLAGDPTRYVIRSVANHLNDLSKKDPELVLAVLREWQENEINRPKELEYLKKHALRTLLKQGHPLALEFLGYPVPAQLSGTKLSLSSHSLQLGESLTIQCHAESIVTQKLLIHYKLYYADRAGSPSRESVFQWAQRSSEPGEPIWLNKTIPFRPMTTRALYSGLHKVGVLINGKELATEDFELLI